jgi:hypothetical protein
MTTFLPAISHRYSNESGLKITGRPSRASISAADGGIGESVFGTAKPRLAISSISRALSFRLSIKASSGRHRAKCRSSSSRCRAMKAIRRSEDARRTGRSRPRPVRSRRR